MTEVIENFEDDANQDVFDDTEQSVESTEDETEVSEVETDDKQEDEAPSAEEEVSTEAQSDKMIPEHRFKAAIKDVNDKFEAAQQEIAQLKAKPIPDQSEDPEGYNFHIRMETSKEVMRETAKDYDEVITHYQTMAKESPYINEAVAAHPSPAKHAYDIAKKDIEIRKLQEQAGSDDWKEFQEFKKAKAKMAKENVADTLVNNVAQPKTKLTNKVPNLNRATDVSNVKAQKTNEDEELFEGAL